MAEQREWTFEIRERSAGVYEGLATHVSGSSISACGEDPEALLARLRLDAGES